MTAEQNFLIVSVGFQALQFALPIALMFLPKPRHTLARASVAVLLVWVASFFYIDCIYNPAGIAFGHALGEHFPENRYDNNTTAIALMAGWFWPAISVGVLLLVRNIWRKVRLTHPSSGTR
ncbi:MAG: hypothetical protein ABL934_19425 [Lysobacteraceae bacterium]